MASMQRKKVETVLHMLNKEKVCPSTKIECWMSLGNDLFFVS